MNLGNLSRANAPYALPSLSTPSMNRPSTSSIANLRQAIAARAARMIAEEGLDYASAKRKALREVAGSARLPGDMLPGNECIESEVRAYQLLFQAESQPLHLARLRRNALLLMQLLADFRPQAYGALVNGTASEHSEIHLLLVADSAKDVEIFLLNQGIDFEARSVGPNGTRNKAEMLSFLWRPPAGQQSPDGVHLLVCDHDTRLANLLGVPDERATPAALTQLLEQTP